MMISSSNKIPTTLIIDFYDSYTRNLLSSFSNLTTINLSTIQGNIIREWDLTNWQERVIVINVDSMTWESFVETILPYVSCVILGPGPGSPHKSEDFSWPTRLIQEFGHVLPILGVCLGHQGLATSFGGNVIKAPAPIHGQLTSIRHDSNPLFRSIPTNFGAIQFNSLVVSDEGLPDELEPIAWGFNKGIENIMALRHRSKPLWGVQFHPESIASTYGTTLLSNFLQLVQSHHSSHPSSINPLHPFPPLIRSLTTSYIRGAPNSIPDIPSLDPASNLVESRRWKWEMRSIVLEGPKIALSPEEVFEQFVKKGENGMGEIWLDSARATVSSQFSHLLIPQLTWSYCQSNHTITIRSPRSTHKRQLTPPSNFFTALGTSQAHLKRHTHILDPESPSVPIGFVGYLGYEMKETTLPFCASKDGEERTDAEFAFASSGLSYEHSTGDWRATGLVRVASTIESMGEEVAEGDGEGFGLSPVEWKDYLSSVLQFFTSPISTVLPEEVIQPTSISLASLTPDLDSTPYQSAINSAKDHIIAGSAYELCLTTQFRRTLPSSIAQNPYSLYKSLRSRNPAPYSAYFHLPYSKIALLSSSPERYMRIESTGFVEMKPIKGTVRRCLEDPIEDERRRKGLEADEKERAENLMIVDLCRNDLLGFCKVETVKVPRLMVVESYQTVHQLVSSIVGNLSPVVNPFEAIARAFPPGSMTGAPKLRSVQLLEELEGHRVRGVYSGVFGYVAVDGTTDFSVVIRTLVIRGNQITMGAGGAITHLSVPENEWEEALIKAEAVLGSK